VCLFLFTLETWISFPSLIFEPGFFAALVGHKPGISLLVRQVRCLAIAASSASVKLNGLACGYSNTPAVYFPGSSSSFAGWKCHPRLHIFLG